MQKGLKGRGLDPSKDDVLPQCDVLQFRDVDHMSAVTLHWRGRVRPSRTHREGPWRSRVRSAGAHCDSSTSGLGGLFVGETSSSGRRRYR